MQALCLMLSGTSFAKNYAGIIGQGLVNGVFRVFLEEFQLYEFHTAP